MVTVVEDKAPAAEERYRTFLDDILKKEGFVLQMEGMHSTSPTPTEVFLKRGFSGALFGYNTIARIEENIRFSDEGKAKPNQTFRLFLCDQKYKQQIMRIAQHVEKKYYVKSEVKYEPKE